MRRPSLAALLTIAGAVAALAAPPAPLPDGTLEQVALLREWVDKMNPSRLTLFINDRRLALVEGALKRARTPAERLDLRFMYGTELLNTGRNEDSAKVFAALEEDLKIADPQRWRTSGSLLTLHKAMAYVRLAEEENCHQLNNRDSCLWPIRGEGIHKKKTGSTQAIETLLELLERDPDNLSAKWLLNVAHMTLGSYPDGVPRAHLVPPIAFASEHPLPEFPNVARDVGLDLLGLSGGVVMEDFDNDGLLDFLMSSAAVREQARFFKNRGDGSFEDRTEGSGLVGQIGGLNMVHADYDNDGFADAVILRGGWMGMDGRFPLSLLRNNGDGTFRDVTKAAGVLRIVPTQTAVWFDYNSDGWLDLFVGYETSPGTDTFPCQLFRSNRDGTFTEVAAEVGLDFVGFVKGATSADYDNDGRPDLYLSVAEDLNHLFHNDGPQADGKTFRFTDVTARARVAEPRASFSTFFFDYDNDGWADLWVSGYGSGSNTIPLADAYAADLLNLPTKGERGRLYRNRGDGTFDDATMAAGLYRIVPTMGLNFGDLDNDGWLDFYLATGNPDFSSVVPNRMFRNDGGRRFQDVTSAGNFGHIQKGHGVAFGDLDNDGDQDVYVRMGGAYLADTAYSALYENPGNGNPWVVLELEGVKTNRKAIGARIAVEVEGQKGKRTIHRTVSGGGSFGASPFRQEIGLGDAKRIVSVRVSWPVTGEFQTFTDLKPGRRYVLREGSNKAKELTRPRFVLGGKKGAVAGR
jgi:hypothetical protein